MTDVEQVGQVMDTASKIVDAVNNTDTQKTATSTPTPDMQNTGVEDVKTDSTQQVTKSTQQVAQQQTVNDNLTKTTQDNIAQQESTVDTPEALTTGVQTNNSSGYLKQIFESTNNFIDYAKKLGYSATNSNGKLFVNNAEVDYKQLGIVLDMQGKFSGTQAQYDQILNIVKGAGYTTGLNFNDYVSKMGLSVNKVGNIFNIDGKEIDFSQYTSLGVRNINGIWTGSETAYKKIIQEVSERSDKNLVDYLNDQGMNAQIIDNKLFINNKEVTWKDYGLKKVFSNVVGTTNQYEQISKTIESEGYTAKENITDYLKNQGIKVGTSTLENIAVFNGKLVDLSAYDSMKNNGSLGWGGTEEDYKKILKDVQDRSQFTLNDYTKTNKMSFYASSDGIYINGRKVTKEQLKENSLQLINGKVYGSDTKLKKLVSETLQEGYTSNNNLYDYLSKKGVTVNSNPIENVADLNGKPVDLSMYDLESIPGSGWAGSEQTYQQIMTDLKNRTSSTFEEYGESNGANVQSSNGKYFVNGREYSAEDLRSYGVQVIDGQLYGSKAQFNSVIEAAKNDGYATDLDVHSYLGSKGMDILGDTNSNIALVNGKPIDLNNYDIQQINGQWVGSQLVYDQIAKDVEARADSDFNSYVSRSLGDLVTENGRYYLNGTDVTTIINNSGMDIIDGKLYGTEAQFDNAIAKIEEPYTYKSAFEEEIQNALDDINSFQAYQTPQETLDIINQLVQTAQEKFNYNPSEDSALLIAQKEAERQVREGSATKGMLYSSGTMESATRKMAELIPQFEQAAYNRFQQEQSRVINVMNAVMQWDKMQSDQHMDQFSILTNKFDAIVNLDNRALSQFNAVLEQRNKDKQYELDLKKFALDKKAAEMEQAWETVDNLGYVDEKTSVILGVPVGTPAVWVKQMQEQYKQDLELQKQQQAYEAEQFQKQSVIDRQLVEYKAQLDAANQQQILAAQYENEKKLANREAAWAQAQKMPQQRYGARNNYVRTLQQKLNEKGYGLSVDGSFGPKTLAAVRDFQSKNGLSVDGAVGPQTWFALLQ